MTILIALGCLIVLVLIAAAFAGKEFVVTREIIINNQAREIFDFIRLLGNHHTFSKWTTKEANRKKEARGIDGTEGFVLTWDNYKEKAGIGELEIKKIIDGERIDLEHRYLKPVKGMGMARLETQRSSESQTRVVWTYHGISKYPINLATALLNMEKIIGGELEKGLAKLKVQMEK